MQETDANTTLGSFIRNARHNKKIGLRELARTMNISASYLSRVENDLERIPSEEVLADLADELSLEFAQLCFIAKRMPFEIEAMLFSDFDTFHEAYEAGCRKLNISFMALGRPV